MALGFGLCFGPLIGVIVFRMLGYRGTMYFFGMIVLSVGWYSIKLMPDNLNENDERTIAFKVDYVEFPMIGDKPFQSKKTKLFKVPSLIEENVTKQMFLKNKAALIALISYFVATMSLVFLNPILTIHLESLGMNHNNVGLGFAIIALTFSLGAPVMGSICKTYDRK